LSRRSDLILLLGSLDDHLPALGSSTRTSPGLAANARKPCPDCGHTDTPGWRVDGFKRRTPCLSCGGRSEAVGTVGNTQQRHRRGRGWVHYDPMDALQRPVQTTEQTAPPTKPAQRVLCDACGGSGVGGAHLDEDGSEYREPCFYCDGSGKRVLARFDLELELVERGYSYDVATEHAITTRDKLGSYHELDQALAKLPPPWRKVVYDVHVNRLVDERDLGETEAYRLTAAMRDLEARMPERIRVPGAVRANQKLLRDHAKALRGKRGLAVVHRDKEIRKLVRVGRPVQWVAREYGLTVRRVYQIVNGEQEAA